MSITEYGYAIVPNAFSKDQVAHALERVKYWFDVSLNNQSDRMPKLNKDQPMVYNLQAKERLFSDMVLAHPVVEGIMMHFLNDRWFTSLPNDAPNYILRSFLARSSNYRMPMHIDSFVPYVSDHPFIMQCSVLLEDQSRKNGCTVIVPKSHRSGGYVDQNAFDNAVPIEANAGDMVFWDSRIWHGALENTTDGTRWSMIATFCRWWIKQAFDIPGNIPQELYDQLDDRMRAVLGYCSVPYDDETRGIDMKRGYDLLPEKVADYKA
ncbi:MAG: phytanoyl-CoA dioxygenase family protein [Silicimonas sp.]|nr:phytanoyl-CoA dioxygenase family protein [Silicimonas sp.]